MNLNSRDYPRIALITGANKGIGREVARQLGLLGYRIALGSRDTERGLATVRQLQLEGVDAGLVVLDVTSEQSISDATRTMRERFGKLDVLVNNAGVLKEADFSRREDPPYSFWVQPSEVSQRILNDTFATNFFGAVLVTNHMLPLLRASPAGRIVNVSSRLSSLGETTVGAARHLALLAYNSSKSALNCATLQYAHELRNTAIKINCVDPGHCATDINGHSGTRTPAQAARAVVKLATLGPDGPTGEFHGEDGKLPW
jgi:NAD(P)-dependent dehydrogenase (short-subunit alcohol dehydrogenase family)